MCYERYTTETHVRLHISTVRNVRNVKFQLHQMLLVYLLLDLDLLDENSYLSASMHTE